MLNRRYAFRSGHIAGRVPKTAVHRFTPTLEDILLSIDGKASAFPDFRPDRPAPSGPEQRR